MLEFLQAKIVLELWQALLFVPGFAFLAHGFLQFLETKQDGISPGKPSTPNPKPRAQTPRPQKTEGRSSLPFKQEDEIAQGLPFNHNFSYTHAPENFFPLPQIAVQPQGEDEAREKPPSTEQPTEPETLTMPPPPERWAEDFNEHLDLLPLEDAPKCRLKRALSQTPERFYAQENRWPPFDEWCDMVLAGKLKPRQEDENGLRQVGKQTIEALKTAITTSRLTRGS